MANEADNAPSIAEISARLIDIVSDYAGEGVEFASNSHIQRDLGLDSLDLLELQIDVEDEFGIVVADDDWLKLETPGSIVEYLHHRLTRDHDGTGGGT